MDVFTTYCPYCLQEFVFLWSFTSVSSVEHHLKYRHGFSDLQVYSERVPNWVMSHKNIDSCTIECHAPQCWLNSPVEIPEDIIEQFTRNHIKDFKHLVVVKTKNSAPRYYGKNF